MSGALAALNTLLNGINAIYERDLAVHINLIAGLTPVIYTDPNTDPYTNGNPNAMIDQVTTALGANIPSGNYDFGHVIGTEFGEPFVVKEPMAVDDIVAMPVDSI